jgi:hypothetical protein
MNININKTKVIIFNKSGRLITRNFNINNQNIECVKTYKYLGIMLAYCLRKISTGTKGLV